MKAYNGGMIYTFEVEGNTFNLLATESAEKEEAFLFVDGQITDVRVKITGIDRKSRWDRIIEDAEEDLQRCFSCGRARKKWLADMRSTIAMFKQARDGTYDHGTPTPRPPVR